jgi:hypothetical protein
LVRGGDAMNGLLLAVPTGGTGHGVDAGYGAAAAAGGTSAGVGAAPQGDGIAAADVWVAHDENAAAGVGASVGDADTRAGSSNVLTVVGAVAAWAAAARTARRPWMALLDGGGSKPVVVVILVVGVGVRADVPAAGAGRAGCCCSTWSGRAVTSNTS